MFINVNNLIIITSKSTFSYIHIHLQTPTPTHTLSNLTQSKQFQRDTHLEIKISHSLKEKFTPYLTRDIILRYPRRNTPPPPRENKILKHAENP